MPSMCRYRSQVCTLSERMPPTEVRKDWQHWRDSGEVWHLRVGGQPSSRCPMHPVPGLGVIWPAHRAGVELSTVEWHNAH